MKFEVYAQTDNYIHEIIEAPDKDVAIYDVRARFIEILETFPFDIQVSAVEVEEGTEMSDL